MSVHAGIWNFDGTPVDRDLLREFSESMKHEGPDGEYSHVNGPVALLYRPFHTTEDSRREAQPHISRRGFVVTWDGRLDSREDLLAELRPEFGPGCTDIDLVAAAFDRWETDCFRRIVGDWSVAVWKPDQKELILACDFMAIKHIFYYLKSDKIWWATDIAPIVLLSGERFQIDNDYIGGYFALYPEAHLTPYRSIREVPPGQFVCVRDRNAVTKRYWRFVPCSRIRYKTDVEYEEHFLHVYRQAVSRRLRSDAPILAELSGGLDSSSIVCMADAILAQAGVRAPRLDTISYIDRTEPNGDDWSYLRKVEDYRGISGAHIDVSTYGESDSFDYTEFYPLPGYLGGNRRTEARRSQVIQDGCHRVVLSGIGGDEFLGGVPNPSAQLGDLVLQFKLLTLAKQALAWSLVKQVPWVQLIRDAMLTLLPSSWAQYWAKEAEVESWLGQRFACETRIAIRQLEVDEYFGLRLPSRRSCISGVQILANKMSKRFPSKLALEEIRYPYLDQSLLEFVLSIPASQLLRPGERRSLMRRALVDIVPQDVLSRPSKQFGVRTPLLAIGKNWKHLQTIFQDPLVSRMGFVDSERFQEELLAARNGKKVHIARMLKAISFEFWLRNVARRQLLDGLSTEIMRQSICENAQSQPPLFDHPS
jgi:asparagine synthase (glutamine-hydrolysing)